jgi:Xaa-Pro aminopeptidase
MRKNGYAGILMTDPYMLSYFTEIPRIGGTLVITQNKAIFIVEKFFETAVAGLQNQFEIVFPTSNASIGDILLQTLPHFKGAFAVGPSSNLDATFMSLSPFFKKSEQRHLVRKDEIFAMIRRHKDTEELQNIKTACEITQQGMELAVTLCKRGITEKELSSRIKIFFLQSGANIAFDPVVSFGKNSTIIHYMPSDEQLEDQDLVFVDCAASWNNYLCDMTRVIFLKTPSAALYNIFQTVERAYNAVVQKAKAGFNCSRLNGIAEHVYKKAGLQKYSLGHLGHGVGLAIHEAPSIMDGSKDCLMEHDVIALEPGLSVPGLWAVFLENTFVVHKHNITSYMTMPFYLQVDPDA